MKGMALYIKESQPSPNKAQAMFALADCLRQTSNIVAAAKYFQVLVNEISPANNPYGHVRVPQRLRRVEPAEPTAHDHEMVLSSRHVSPSLGAILGRHALH